MVWRRFMKVIIILVLSIIASACDPYGFGFKKNPAFILNEAFDSIISQDVDAFIEATGKEALCIYGNNDGLTYLKENLTLNVNDYEIKPQLIENSSRYNKFPQFVGYWSYYSEKYLVDISDKVSKSELLKVVVECHFGFDGEKSDDYQNLELKKYKKKECKLIKIMPSKFDGMPLEQQCDVLSVKL